MPVSKENLHERLALTREAAAAFVQDIQHMRELLMRPDPPLADLRRLSVTLRRILLNRDVASVAAPRIGRIALNAPDNIPVVRSNEAIPIGFFASGGIEAFGITIRSLIVETSKEPREKLEWDRSKIISIRLDGFLSQPVLCLQGKWATRGNVIDYMANMASAAHTGTVAGTPIHKREIYDLVARMRNAACYSRNSDTENVEIVILQNVFEGGSSDFIYRPTAIDPVSFELGAAAHFLTISPDIIEIERIVTEELKAYSYPPK